MSAADSKEVRFTVDDEGDTVTLPTNVWLNYDAESDTATLGVGTKSDVTITVDELRDLYPFIRRLVATGSMREPEPAPQPEPERVVVRGWFREDPARMYYTEDDGTAAEVEEDGSWSVFSRRYGLRVYLGDHGGRPAAIAALRRLHPGLVIEPIDQQEEG